MLFDWSGFKGDEACNCVQPNLATVQRATACNGCNAMVRMRAVNAIMTVAQQLTKRATPWCNAVQRVQRLTGDNVQPLYSIGVAPPSAPRCVTNLCCTLCAPCNAGVTARAVARSTSQLDPGPGGGLCFQGPTFAERRGRPNLN